MQRLLSLFRVSCWLAPCAVMFAVAASSPARADFGDFPRVPALEPNVAFWKRVYSEWSVNNIAFHDENDLGLVYRVITVPARGERGPGGLTRKEAIRRGQNEVEAALRSLAKKNPTNESGLSSIEKEIFNNLKNNKRADKYSRLSTVRPQNGLRERFMQGWTNSGLYWSFIEAEMKRNGLPPELIGVAFVESLFYVGAKSKVGAAGVWQFMSYTGKEYMQLNSVVDERYDPILATEAAAKYLRQAKKELGTWPLAITSYNYGRGGMRALANTAGTNDFGVILAVSKAKRFGFAARNYYASFLAILDILKNKDVLLKGQQRKAAWAYDVVRLPFPLYTTQIAGTGLLDLPSIEALNPALMNAASDGKIPLPHGFSMRVPKGVGQALLGKLAALPERERERGLRAVRATHKANGKQTVSEIARKNGVPVEVLASALGRAANEVPSKGQQVPIPHVGARYTLLPEARGLSVPAAPAATPAKVLVADASAAPVEPEPVVPSDADKPEPTETVLTSTLASKGRVTVGRIAVTRISEDLPAVDVIASSGASIVPVVDVVAGDPGLDAPWIAPDAPGEAAPGPTS